jgi:hypothetical protein
MLNISYARGRGKIDHNNRTFLSPNVNKDRVVDNIIIKQQTVSEAYKELFSESTENYNKKQKRSDRKKPNHFKELFGKDPDSVNTILKNENGQQSFYEYVVGIGNRDETGFESNPEAAKIAVECLQEYINGFEERNPQFHIFNAIIHCDEATPHLHYDFIPWADGYKNGLEKRNGIAKALEQMGYGSGKEAYKNFTQSERKVFREICERKGFEVAPEKESRGYTFSPEAYREYGADLLKTREELNETEAELDDVYNELDDITAQKNRLEQERYDLEQEVDELNDYADKIYSEINAAEMYRAEEIRKKFFEENERYKNKFLKMHGTELEKTYPEERLREIKKEHEKSGGYER